MVSDSDMSKRGSRHMQAVAMESGAITLKRMPKTGHYREIRNEVWILFGFGKWDLKPFSIQESVKKCGGKYKEAY